MSTLRGPLRGPLKRALGHAFAAPEVLYNILVSSSLDPVFRWILAGLRLWHEVLREQEVNIEIEMFLGGSRGRLTNIAKAAATFGTQVLPTGFRLDTTHVSSREPWYVVKKAVTSYLKTRDCLSLAARRPETFGGLKGFNVKAHRSLLRSLDVWDQ